VTTVEFLARLHGVTPSPSRPGPWMARCSPSAVLAALGLRMADLFEAPLLRDPLTLAAFARAKQLPVENPPEDVDGPEAAGGTP
jgi:hypothetical protein